MCSSTCLAVRKQSDCFVHYNQIKFALEPLFELMMGNFPMNVKLINYQFKLGLFWSIQHFLFLFLFLSPQGWWCSDISIGREACKDKHASFCWAWGLSTWPCLAHTEMPVPHSSLYFPGPQRPHQCFIVSISKEGLGQTQFWPPPRAWKTPHPSSCILLPLSSCSDSFKNHRAFLSPKCPVLAKEAQFSFQNWLEKCHHSFFHQLIQSCFSAPKPFFQRRDSMVIDNPVALDVTGPLGGNQGVRKTGNLRSMVIRTVTKGLHAQVFTEVTMSLSSNYKTMWNYLRLPEFLSDPWQEASPSKTKLR